MTSKIFYCSRQRAMNLAQEVLHEMKLRKETVDTQNHRISARRGWNFMNPPREVEITMYTDDNRVEVAVNVESQIGLLNFGTNEYLEEEFLMRMKERLN